MPRPVTAMPRPVTASQRPAVTPTTAPIPCDRPALSDNGGANALTSGDRQRAPRRSALRRHRRDSGPGRLRPDAASRGHPAEAVIAGANGAASDHRTARFPREAQRSDAMSRYARETNAGAAEESSDGAPVDRVSLDGGGWRECARRRRCRPCSRRRSRRPLHAGSSRGTARPPNGCRAVFRPLRRTGVDLNHG